MAVDLMMDAIEVGIVTTNPDQMLAFYRDTLGLEYAEEMPFPGGKMHRLKCGSNIIKLVMLDSTPEKDAAPGGHTAATGYRYFSLGVNNMREVVSACQNAGYNVPVPVTGIFEGFGFAFLEDPDGNWVELFGPLK